MPHYTTRSDALPLYCTMNTFSPELHPAAVIEHIGRIGYAGCDLSCDGAFYPYSASTIAEIEAALAASNMQLANVNSMTTAYFWRDRGIADALQKNTFKGPDITDEAEAYAPYGITNPMQWRLDRIEDCMKLAARLNVPRLNTNVGGGVDVEREELWPRVHRALSEILAMSRRYGVQVCIETEETLFISSRRELMRVWSQFPTDAFLWGFDVGHQIKHYRGDHKSVVDDIRDMGPAIGYFHVEDISKADWEGDPLRHRHLTVGEGDIDFAFVFGAVGSLQRLKASRAEPLIPVYFENYTAFDVDVTGSAHQSFTRLRRILRELDD